jgi:N-acetylglucosaminyldiphosphoundecaprenol N-acetyl-beta-D-mannosaminyltransferase
VNQHSDTAGQKGGAQSEKMSVSIVVPVRDRWNALVDCLRSLANQDHIPLEVIVVDDGSTKPIPEVLRQCNPPFALRFVKESRLGIAAARNTGIHYAAGQLIVLTDSDCVFRPSCLRELLISAANHPADVAFQLAFVLGKKRLVWLCDGLALGAKQHNLQTASGHIRYLATGGFAIRRSYVDSSSPLFNVADTRGSDTSLLARVLREGHLPRFVQSAHVEHRPVHGLIWYLLRHFSVGYRTSPARARLCASSDVLLKGAGRAGVLHTAWKNACNSSVGLLAFLFLLIAYTLELCGRTFYKVVGMRPGRTEVLGVQVDCLHSKELQSRILSAAEAHSSDCITYLTAWSLVQSQRNVQFKKLLREFDICYADGIGVVLAALLLNAHRIEKVTANDFFFALCEDLSHRELSVALVGGEQWVIEKVCETLRKRIPRLAIRLSLSGYLSEAENRRLNGAIAESKPDIVVLAMGQPLQEQLALRLRHSGAQAVFLCVGGLFDYIAGRNATPPALIRWCGLEWLWRLAHSPRRLWKRYVLGIPALGMQVLCEWIFRLKALILPSREENFRLCQEPAEKVTLSSESPSRRNRALSSTNPGADGRTY